MIEVDIAGFKKDMEEPQGVKAEFELLFVKYCSSVLSVSPW